MEPSTSKIDKVTLRRTYVYNVQMNRFTKLTSLTLAFGQHTHAAASSATTTMPPDLHSSCAKPAMLICLIHHSPLLSRLAYKNGKVEKKRYKCEHDKKSASNQAMRQVTKR